ncbi:MAG: alpha/beta fold hydrolase [Spirosomataceae bacterium]
MKKLLLFLLVLTTKASWAQDCNLSYSTSDLAFQSVEGLKIAYQEETARRSPNTVIFLHGLGGNLTHWSQTKLSNTHVIRMDLPGYGYSDPIPSEIPSDQLLTFYAEKISQFIEAKKLKNVLLVGHSMGGQIAVHTALLYPEKIQKLALIAPAGLETFSEKEAAVLINYAQPSFFKLQTEPQVRAGFLSNFYQFPASAEFLVADRMKLAQCSSFDSYFSTVAGGVKSMLNQPIREKLGEMKQPTLVIFGRQDALIPNKLFHPTLTTETVAQISSEIPTSQLELIDGAGHLVMFEQAERVNKLLTIFIHK